jgi:hypothetical protein
VRVIDVLSLLNTVAGLPTLYRSGRTWVSRIVRHRLLAAIILLCLACSLLLEGCAGLAVGESKSSPAWGISRIVEETQSRLLDRRVVVSGFAFASMPASGWMAVAAQPWRRPEPVAIGAVFAAPVALA